MIEFFLPSWKKVILNLSMREYNSSKNRIIMHCDRKLLFTTAYTTTTTHNTLFQLPQG